MATQAAQISGVAAGVPFVAVPPSTGPSASAPLVVAWHMLDPPRTERAFAAAVPLRGLDAWRIYLGLPMCGSRTPPGGWEEIMRLGLEDAVLNLHGPITSQAAQEFEAALADLRGQLDLGDWPIGVLGGSAGAAVAQLAIVEGNVGIKAAVLVNPLVQLHRVIEAVARHFDTTYPWSEPSVQVARRLDFVARTDEIAQRDQPAVLLVVGSDDDPQAFREPAARLRESLASRYTDPARAELVMIAGMGHPLAEEPGIDPAPQSPHAAEVDRHAVQWLRRHLCGTIAHQVR